MLAVFLRGSTSSHSTVAPLAYIVDEIEVNHGLSSMLRRLQTKASSVAPSSGKGTVSVGTGVLQAHIC